MRIRARSRLAAAALGVLLSVAVVGCGGSGTQGGTATGAGQGPPDRNIKTTLTIWSYNDKKNFPYVNDWIDLFNEKYPNVKVNWVYVDFAKLTPKLLGAALSGDLPDGISSTPVSIPDLDKAGILMDMTKYWQGYQDRDKFPTNVVWKYEGKVLGVQGYVNLLTLWYNEKILDELGLQPPKTVAEFDQALKAAHDAGHTPLTLSCQPNNAGEGTVSPWMLSEGVYYGDWEHGPTTEVFQRFRQWMDAGYIPKDCVGWDINAPVTKFLDGDVAFTMGGNWDIGKAKKQADFEVGAAPNPAGPGGSHSIVTGEAVSILSKSEHPDLMWEFWKDTALSKAGELASLKSNGTIPARSDLADDPNLKSPMLQTYTREVVPQAVQRPSSPKINDAVLTLGQLFNAVVSGQKDPNAAATQLKTDTSYIQSK